ncbi:hypothetical protein CEXT_500641 [Caerostris extrusa]|uniref:Uncharacterized protein n=1 Tax=Caerostris extrusa TaxID=172846 RepID=A0AAV4VNN4_CAEEX|nr:hypothetical protein CEXT_500641 [Caerostris extrusa]
MPDLLEESGRKCGRNSSRREALGGRVIFLLSWTSQLALPDHSQYHHIKTEKLSVILSQGLSEQEVLDVDCRCCVANFIHKLITHLMYYRFLLGSV